MEMLSNYPIHALNLPNRVTKKLEDSGIFTLLDLSKWDYEKLLKIHGFGPPTISLINKKLSKLLIENTDVVFAEDSTLSSLLKVVGSEISAPDNFSEEMNLKLRYLNELKKCLDLLEFSEKEKVILEKRLKFFNSPITISKNYTLQEIADLAFFKTTRERIRQIEKRISNKIGNVIELFNKNNPSLFNSFVESLRSEVSDVVVIRWPDEYRVLLSYNYASIGFTENFLFYLVDEFVLHKSNLQVLNIDGDDYIVDLYPDGFSVIREISIDAIKYLKKNSKPTIFERELIRLDNNLSLKQKIIIRKIIQDHSDYSYDSRGIYIKKTMYLSDLVYQILDKEGEPLHFAEVAIKLRSCIDYDISDHNVQAILGRSKGIHPVGRGKYALSKWGLKIYSIDRFYGKLSVDSLIEQLLRDKGAQQYEIIREHVLSHRAASENTIRQGLGRLGCVQNKQKQYYWFEKKTTLHDVIKNLIESNGPQTRAELISHAKKMGYSQSYIRVMLSTIGLKMNSEGKYFLSNI